MAFDVSFDPAKAHQLKECLASGRPIEGISTIDDMLMLAGLCFHRLVFLMPTIYHEPKWLQYSANPERAAFETMLEELKATVEHVGHCFIHLQRGKEQGTSGKKYCFRASLSGETVTFTPIADEHDTFNG